MESQAAWIMPVLTACFGAIAFLYRQISAIQKERAEDAEQRADALQETINARAAEFERKSIDAAVEIALMRDRTDRLQQIVGTKEISG